MTRAMQAFSRVLPALVALVLVGCGGGGDEGTEPAPAAPMGGSVTSRSVTSAITGSSYPLSVYLPPASAGSRATLPVVYALDGDWWFQELVSIAESTRSRVIIIGIGNNALRVRDYVPANTCNPGGGGNVAFLSFIRLELIPFVEGSIGGDAARRVLIGHSYGGTFVLYALFAQAPGAHAFHSYLASDSSISCMPEAVNAWESAYAAAYTSLPVRVHISHAGGAPNVEFAQRLASRRYNGLLLKEQGYAGTHTGIIPAAFRDAVLFALAP